LPVLFQYNSVFCIILHIFSEVINFSNIDGEPNNEDGKYVTGIPAQIITVRIRIVQGVVAGLLVFSDKPNNSLFKRSGPIKPVGFYYLP